MMRSSITFIAVWSCVILRDDKLVFVLGQDNHKRWQVVAEATDN